MKVTSKLDWHPNLLDPTGKRTLKPRTTGKTMVIDKGLGLHAFEDLLESSGEHIDMLKIGFGTSVLYPPTILQEKIRLAQAHNICILPGGTFLEAAVNENVIFSFFETIKFLGFTGIEVSDGTIELQRQLRNELIALGVESGFTVITEYGKKLEGSVIEIEDLQDTVHQDIECGSSLVTIEGRESGVGVGIYDRNGACNDQDIHKVIEAVKDPSMIMWETPLKNQQVHFIKTLGADTNLGNIAPEDIMSVESLRRGLRSDTFCIRER
jgi:phosphosulfolactate synthase